MKKIFLLLTLCFSISIYAQVGVGTTSPEPSSALDISATDKGVLVPRVSLIDVTNATAPVNTPATGLLVWNTNAAVTGGNGVGFYFFNGAQWVPIQETVSDDADFYEEGTTTAPDDINDDMYTQGNIGIGQTTTDYKLDITESTALKVIDISLNGDIDGNRVAIDNNVSGTQNPGIANRLWGLRNQIFSGGGFAVYGVENRLSGNYNSQKYGVLNYLSGGTGNHYGISNFLSGNDPSTGNLRFGVQNDFNYDDPSNGDERGINNSFQGTSTGPKSGLYSYFTFNSDATAYGKYSDFDTPGDGNLYGNYVTNTSNGDGEHYGTFANLSGEGTGFKYGTLNRFSGAGTGRITGQYNDIFSTGGSANYGLHNNFSGNSFDERGVYNQFQQSDSSNRYGLYNDFDSSSSLSPTDYGVFTLMTGDSNSNQYGIYQSIGTTGFGTHYGFFNQLNGGGGTKLAIVNEMTIPNSGEATGVHNTLSAALSSSSAIGNHNEFFGVASVMTGVKNEFSGSEALEAKGVDNDFSGTTVSGSFNYSVFSLFNNNSNGNQYGAYNEFAGALGEMYGVSNLVIGGAQRFYGLYNQITSTASSTEDKYGVYNVFDSTAGGTHYGIYSQVGKSGSYAGYFLGDVSIGTSGVDNYIMPDSDGLSGQIMQTDGVGNVDWVDKDSNSFSVCRANINANQILNTTGWQKVRFNTTLYDTNAEFDTALNRFVADNDGYYTINAGYHTAFQGNIQFYGIAVYINNVLYQESSHNHHNVGDVTRSINCTAFLSEDDYVEIFVQNFQANDGTNGPNGVELDSFTGKTFFEVQRIR